MPTLASGPAVPTDRPRGGYSTASTLGACFVGAALTLAAVYMLPAGSRSGNWAPAGLSAWAAVGMHNCGRQDSQAFERVAAVAGRHAAAEDALVWSSALGDGAISRGAGFAGNYMMFRNVAWEDGAIGFAAEDPQVALPEIVRNASLDFCDPPPCAPNVTLRVRRGPAERAADNPFEQCRVWVEKPAILFSNSYSSNFYHYICQGVAGILYVLQDCSSLPGHLSRLLQPGSDSVDGSCLIGPSDDVMVVAMHESQLEVPWRYMMDAISGDQRIWSTLRGHCFRTLIVIKAMKLAFAGGYVERDPPAAEARFHFFSQLAFRAALSDKARQLSGTPEKRAALAQAGCRAENLPGAPLQSGSRWRSGGDLPRVTWSSRHGSSRDVLNEEDIFAFIRDNYDVEMFNTTFSGHLYDTMQDLQRTDVFMGMHGAGMTNIMWLPVGVTVLQLFPYGWQQPSGEVLRESLYSQMTIFKRGNYLRWVNPHPHNAFFRRQNLDKKNQWRKHPDDSMERPRAGYQPQFWIAQNTFVDMDSFKPVLEEALAKAGVPKHSSAAQ